MAALLGRTKGQDQRAGKFFSELPQESFCWELSIKTIETQLNASRPTRPLAHILALPQCIIEIFHRIPQKGQLRKRKKERILTLALLPFVVKMTRGRFDAEMTRSAFSDTRNRSPQLVNWSRRLYERFAGGRREGSSFRVFLQPNKLCEPRRHHHERRYQQPKPPALSDSSRKHNRDDDKCNA